MHIYMYIIYTYIYIRGEGRENDKEVRNSKLRDGGLKGRGIKE